MTNPTNQGGELKACPFCGAKINPERDFHVWDCGNSMPICGEPEYLRSYWCMERQIANLEASNEVLGLNTESLAKRSENYLEVKDELSAANETIEAMENDQACLPEDRSVTETVKALRDENVALEDTITELKQEKLNIYSDQHDKVKALVELATEVSELLLKESMEREAALEAKMAQVKAWTDLNIYILFTGKAVFHEDCSRPQPLLDILSESRPALAVVEGYSLDGCFPDDVFMDGRMQIYEEQTDEQEMLYTVVVLERTEP